MGQTLSKVGISIAITTLATCCVLVGAALPWINANQSMRALVLKPAPAKNDGESNFKPEDVKKLLVSIPFQAQSVSKGFVTEAPWREGTIPPLDLDTLGYNKSTFLADNRWATIRFIGPDPAGAGLTGDAFNIAQTQALGLKNDSIPVTTAAYTIEQMMEKFFAPILLQIPGGEEILPRIKINGAYFSPLYESTAEVPLEHDNAFIVGLQSLYIYPSSCFETTAEPQCKPPFYSTGHDPTVIGHELGHVIFNHLRGQKSLDGFQWFAVNEGYADYFSASFFNEPVLGRIWKVNRASAPYLRSLLDSPTAFDEVAYQEAHSFSVAWSSALRRAHLRLIQAFKPEALQIEKVILYSIVFLGETDKLRLGDAATAVLKSAEVLGHPEWKKIFREEFEKSDLQFHQTQDAKQITLTDSAIADSNATKSDNSCGKISAFETYSHSNTSLNYVILILILSAPLLLLLNRKKITPIFITKKPMQSLSKLKKLKLFIVLLFTFQFFGCVTRDFNKPTENSSLKGKTIIYNCNAQTLDPNFNSVSNSPKNNSRQVHFTFVEQLAQSTTQKIIVSDENGLESPSAIVLVVDRPNHKIDQVRNRKGEPFESDLSAKYMDLQMAQSQQNLRFGQLITDSATRAVAAANSRFLKANSNSADKRNIIGFLFENQILFADGAVKGELGAEYGPLPATILKLQLPQSVSALPLNEIVITDDMKKKSEPICTITK